MSLTRQAPTVEYWVVFDDSNYDHWLFKYLMPCFRHCYIIKESEGGHFWTVVESLRGHIDVRLLLQAEYPHPRTFIGENATILRVTAKIDPNKASHHLCVFNCVEVTKRFLGINSFFTWTPWQLYRYLIGGKL